MSDRKFSDRHPGTAGALFVVGIFLVGIAAAPVVIVAARWWWSLFLP